MQALILATLLSYSVATTSLKVTSGGLHQTDQECTSETATTCYIKNARLAFSEDTTIEVTNKDLVFENAVLTCRKLYDTKGDPCDIYLKIINEAGRYTTAFQITEYTIISARSLVIDGYNSELIVDDTSSFNLDG